MDSKEFKALYLPHKVGLFRMALYLLKSREEAEDVVQDTYEKLWQERENLCKVENSEAFSITILRNLCYDRLNRLSNRCYHVELEEYDLASTSVLESQLEARSELRLVYEALKEYPQYQSRVFLLRHKEGYTLEQIATTCELSLSNVKVILSRMRKELKERYYKL